MALRNLLQIFTLTCYRPMHEVQVDIVKSQTLKALIESFLDTAMIGVPKFRGYENVFALADARLKCFGKALTYFVLILVAERTVDMPIA